MLKGLSTQVLQHLIAQNSWANALLQPYAGKAVQFYISPLRTALVILENGSLALAGETGIPDASIIIPPGLLMRLLAKDESAKLKIRIDGEVELATVLAKVLSNIRWDYESDMSRLVGDVPAYKAGELGRNVVATIKETGENLASMLSEYWLEEKPTLAKKRHIEQFNTEVDILRADVERLEKRLNKLARSNNPTSDPNNPVTDGIQ